MGTEVGKFFSETTKTLSRAGCQNKLNNLGGKVPGEKPSDHFG